jgi:hypothetical protein
MFVGGGNIFFALTFSPLICWGAAAGGEMRGEMGLKVVR